jgi:hypothetical protein
MQEPVVEPPQATNRLESGGCGPGRQQVPGPASGLGVFVFGVEAVGAEAVGKVCGVPAARPSGEELGTSLVDRMMVNTGTTSELPFPPAGQVGDGQARCQLRALGWGGACVVVRGRESRPHGEGRQQDRSAGTARPGGRW